MFLMRCLFVNAKNNSYFIFGLAIGFFVTLHLTPIPEQPPLCVENTYQQFTEQNPENQILTTDEYEPKINLRNKPMQAKKAVKSLQRPRYYSTELGIREKLFVGVVTSEININKHATALNKTFAHLANKIKFFITASVVKPNLNLSNIVGFTDTREIMKPFHILKYLCDNYLEEFDYFYLISDVGFVNGRALMDVVNGISVSEDVYMGTTVEEDSHYCSLDAGMLLSNSVVRKIKENLEWCVRNCYSKDYFANIGRCITHSTQLRCTQSIQDRQLTSFKLPDDWNLERDLHQIIENDESFKAAVSVYPLVNYLDFYKLQMYFSRLHLQSLHSLEQTLQPLSSPVSTPGGAHWPAGVREDPTLPAPRPFDRFHQPRYETLKANATLMPDDFVNVGKARGAEKEDMDHIIKAVILKVQNENADLKYHSIVNNYKKFDPSRGMSYIFDMNFIQFGDKDDLILKRMEVFKPLGKAAILTVPYVTENTRIIVLLPIWPYEIDSAVEFLKHYDAVCLEKKDKVAMIVVLLYPAEAPSKGTDDAFLPIKTACLDLSQKYKAEGIRIGWVSVRLPVEHLSRGLLHIGVMDLALRKAPPESLILTARPHIEFKPDFLNRVRMNTIQGYQVFSALGFQRYHPALLSGNSPSKGAGRFAFWNYEIVSFYSRDYVNVRKSIQSRYPIVRSDRDLELLLATPEPDITSLFQLFTVHSSDLHPFRATEPALIFKYNEKLLCPELSQDVYGNSSSPPEKIEPPEMGIKFGDAMLTERCLDSLYKNDFAAVNLGSRSQMAKLIFENTF